MNVAKSIYYLAKSTNGYFSSEKQQAFLMDILQKNEGFVSADPNGRYTVFAECDEKGITKIYHIGTKTKTRNTKFERTNEHDSERIIFLSGIVKECKERVEKLNSLHSNLVDIYNYEPTPKAVEAMFDEIQREKDEIFKYTNSIWK